LAIKLGLKPILCINNISELKDVWGRIKSLIKKTIIAYEPVFAIGTGKPCSLEKAKRVNLNIKKILGQNTIVLYGGSVNSKNAKDFIEKSLFDGLLIGGASLQAKEFVRIVKNT
jgi:triosephosphate isomerase